MKKLSWFDLVTTFYYKDGKFFWRKTFNQMKAGKEAGWKDHSGYIHLKINNKQYRRSYLVWFWHHKKWPEKQIDHKNRIRDDDRIENLRDVTGSINCINRPSKPTNTGYKYIHKNKQGHYQVQIERNNKKIFQKGTKDKEKAIKIRDEAIKNLNIIL